MLSAFQISTDCRSSRLTVVPLAEKERKASGAEWTGGICKKQKNMGRLLILKSFTPEPVEQQYLWPGLLQRDTISLLPTSSPFFGFFLLLMSTKKCLPVCNYVTLLCLVFPLTNLTFFPICSFPVLSALNFLSLFTFLFHGDIK